MDNTRKIECIRLGWSPSIDRKLFSIIIFCANENKLKRYCIWAYISNARDERSSSCRSLTMHNKYDMLNNRILSIDANFDGLFHAVISQRSPIDIIPETPDNVLLNILKVNHDL